MNLNSELTGCLLNPSASGGFIFITNLINNTMKYILKTKDETEHQFAMNGEQLFYDIRDFDNQLRMLAKTDTTLEAEAVRQILRDHLSNINQTLLFGL